ncbi:hypothetical protein Bind_2371 [Beijerinckia indica subsp. indica ATCC 9039]|uniref:Uncharacterized protein n=1 Tax=Beijerinckia indica subsp. indica (strain ATCC 9039 / DSM 1715 / NCIMB 8712) TaxID=395963 RepID=B2IHT9_BEII9|nr:hypothetical protein Bind_2371 [Beijerinckia indica subsp. indica ATCC 9039]
MKPCGLFLAALLTFVAAAFTTTPGTALSLDPAVVAQKNTDAVPVVYYHRSGGYYHRGGGGYYHRGGGYYHRGGGAYYRGGGYYHRGGGCRWVSTRVRGPNGWAVRRVWRCY